MGVYDDALSQMQAPAPSQNPYDVALDQMRQDQQAQAALTVGLQSDANPDEEARNALIAKRYNTTPDVVKAFPAEFKQRMSTELARQALASAPTLQEAINKNPQLGALIHDDIHNTSAIEQSMTAWNPSIGQRVTQWLNDTLGITALNRAKAQNEYAANSMGLDIGQARSAIGGMSELPEQAAGGLLNTATFGLLPNGAGEAQTPMGQVGEGAGSLAGFLTPGGPAKAGDFLLGKLGISALERGAGDSFFKALAKDVAKGAISLGTANVLANTGNAINSPDIGSALKSEGQAGLSGVEMGGIFGAAGRVFPENTIAQTLARVLGVNTAMDLTQGTNPFDERPLEKKIFDYGLNTFFALHGAGVTEGGLFHDAAKAEVATQDFPKFQVMNQLFAASKLRERDPEQFKQFVSDVADRADTPDLYVDARTFSQVLDQSGITGEELTQMMPGVAEQMREGLMTEGTVRIPLEDYASHISGTKVDDALQPHLRTDPEGMTFDEAKHFYQEQAERLKEQVAQVTSDQAENQVFKDSGQQVEDTVRQQLDQANRFPPDVNKAYASMWRSFFESAAAKEGVLPHELLDRYGAEVRPEQLPGSAGTLDQSATLRSGQETLEKYGLNPNGRYNTREIAAALEARQREQYGKIEPTDRSDEAAGKIAHWMAEEVRFEMQHPRKSGVGWYSSKFQRALDKFSEVFPELKKDKDARSVMTALIAVTSDGQKVVPNFRMAADLYSNFRKSGTFSTERGHARQASIDANVKLIQELYDRMGAKGMRQYLLQEATVSDLRKIAKQAGVEFKTDYQAHVKLPMAAVVFGPKLGAFYANLMGAHGYLTMDRWWSRTFNRYRGTLLQAPTREGLDRIKQLNGHPEWSDDQAIAATVEPRNSYADKNFKNGTELEKASNTVYKAAFENLEDAPFNATDRTFMLNAVNKAQEILAAEGRKISVADIQAVLWYYEKRLYGEMGARQSADVSYEEAAKRVTEEHQNAAAGAEGSGAPSDGAGEGGEDAGAVGGRADEGGTPGLDAFEPNGGLEQPGRRDTLDQDARGQIAFARDLTEQPSVISLLKNADLSTFLHESGHFFLEVYSDLAAKGGPDSPFHQDLQKLLDWFGVKDLDTWRSMSIEERREYHEKFARGFEAYLMEGNAPNTQLQSLFGRFRAWLVNVYKNLRSLNVELTPEVRGVMDRMLASEETIQQAEQVRGMKPLFDTKPESMTDDVWEKYQAENSQATEDAISELQAKSVKDMQWLSNAKGKAMKALQREASARRKEIRGEITKEVDAQPVYRAERFIRRGEMEAPENETNAQRKQRESTLGTGTKLDIDALKAMYGDSPAAPWRYLDTGSHGLAGKDGLHPDLVAEMFGFKSGDALVRSLLDMKPRREAIEQATDQRMLERHGELVDPIAVERAAEAAIHNDVRTRFIARELNALANATGSARLLAKAAGEAAEAAINGKKISELLPKQYTIAEGKAARASMLAFKKGDIQNAAIQKRAQLLNNALAKRAAEAQTQIERALKYFQKFDKPTVAKAVGAEYMDRIEELLSRFDLSRKGATLTAITERQNLRDWLQSEFERTGIMPDVSEELLDFAQRQSYRELTVEQFQGLYDSIRSLEHVGREQQMVELNGKREELQSKVDQAKANLADVPHREPVDLQPHLQHATGLDRIAAKYLKLKSNLRGMDAALLKMEQVFQWLDRGKRAGIETDKAGPFLDAFAETARAEGRERQMRAESVAALKDLREILVDAGVDLNESLQIPLPRPGRGEQWYREELIAAALNTGNESNFDGLVKGYGWTPDQVMHVLNEHLSHDEWKFVQGVWDAVGKYSDDISELQRRQTGRTPKMVKPNPVQTKYGTFPGGYYPKVYDAFIDHNIEEKYAKNADTLFENQWARPTTSKGHTIARTNYVGPLHLSLGVIARHLDQVTHDLAWREPIVNINKFLSHSEIRAEVEQTMGREYYKQFRPWLQAMANDKVFNSTGDAAWENFYRKARTNATVVGLGFRLSTMQIHGLSALSSSLGEVGAKWLAKGAAEFATPDRWNNAKQFMFERSPEMANRFNEHDRNIHEAISEINDHQRALSSLTNKQKLVDNAQRFAFFGVSALDMASAAPTWMGAYLKGMAPKEKGGLGMSEEDAIDYANRAVRNAHGGGGVKDLSAVQRDKGVMSLATMFYSFWNHMYNRQRDLAKGYANLPDSFRNGTGTRDFAALLGRSWYYFVVPQLIHALLKPDTSKDNDGSLGHFLSHVADEVALGFVSGVPVLRDLANAAVNGKDYTITPLEQAGKSIVKAAEDAYKTATGEGTSKHAGENAANAAGYVMGLPTGQAATTGRFLWDVWNGDQNPQSLQDWWSGIQHGQAANQ